MMILPATRIFEDGEEPHFCVNSSSYCVVQARAKKSFRAECAKPKSISGDSSEVERNLSFIKSKVAVARSRLAWSPPQSRSRTLFYCGSGV
jgi:hypothetical protein